MKVIGLDVGTKRIGVAKADTSVRIAVPAGVVEVDGSEFKSLARLSRLYGADFFVVGLPRSNEGRQTTQSAYTKNFAADLKKHLPGIKIHFQDESLTSVEAKSRLTKDKKFKKLKPGAIDSEAAAIILQDFLESYHADTATDDGRRERASASEELRGAGRSLATSPHSATEHIDKSNKKGTHKMQITSPMTKILATIAIIAVVLGSAFAAAFTWYNLSLAAVNPACPTFSDLENAEKAKKADPTYPDAQLSVPDGCGSDGFIMFIIDQGDSSDAIATALKEANLIKSPLAFKIYAQLSGEGKEYQAGEYSFTRSMTAQEISAKIARGEVDQNVFSFTIIPGQNIFDIQENLAAYGYSTQEISNAFAKNYDNPVLRDKPADASLEGYLYPETYEFYKDATVEDIIKTALEQMNTAVSDYDLEQKFAAQGLNLNEGITLASIVEEESVKGEYANVAAVFYNRLAYGMALGSDVTAKYAADLLDPNRETYTDNSLVLTIDSPYNTRKYAGLPPAPISNPSLEALEAVASPAENDYLFFLTGDDGMMYYSTTESGHNQNAAEHCQELCNISL